MTSPEPTQLNSTKGSPVFCQSCK